MEYLKIGLYLIVIAIVLFAMQTMLNISSDISAERNGDSQLEKLFWSEEFEEIGQLDVTKWNFRTGDGCPEVCGWGRNEQQFYEPNRLKYSRQENGSLIIEAHTDFTQSKKFRTAAIHTKNKLVLDQNSRLEIRMKQPSKSSGLGSYIKVLPVNESYGKGESSGQIDTRFFSNKSNKLFSSVQTALYNQENNSVKKDSINIKNLSSGFHNYTFSWTDQKLDLMIDSIRYFQFVNQQETYKEWPFDQSFYLDIGLFVGGNGISNELIDTSEFPRSLEIDYIRYYN